ncbi:lytic transglycosylase domain-containing protein, partial [Mesorhizobium sp. M7A.F.Ca.AU.001.01.1.1]
MPGGRPHLLALLGAALALMPGMAISGSVDARVTSAIPIPGAAIALPDLQDRTRQAPLPDVAPLKSGLDALARGDSLRARGVRDALPAQSLDQHILAWAIALYGGDKVPSDDITAAAKMLPNWPGTVALRKNSERALYRENPAPDIVIRAFDGSQPQTFEGVMVLARAYVASSNTKAARSVLSPFWRTAILEAKDEAALIKEFGSLIPAADHRFRMERMFYADRANSALRVAGLAGAQQLADAWAAADKGDKNAPKLLKAVPAMQRSAGYFFAQAEYLRKQEDFAGAAAIVMQAPTDREALVDPDAWWVERRVLSRELVDQGDMKAAYKIVATHAAESATNAADAEFHAGWYALRGLNDPKLAATHFARIADLAQGPMTLSRAYYWLGRAAEVGGPGNAKDYFARAAAYGTTFYGQLAAERVGRQALNIVYPSPSAADRQNFAGREAVSAIKRLQEAG